MTTNQNGAKVMNLKDIYKLEGRVCSLETEAEYLKVWLLELKTDTKAIQEDIKAGREMIQAFIAGAERERAGMMGRAEFFKIFGFLTATITVLLTLLKYLGVFGG